MTTTQDARRGNLGALAGALFAVLWLVGTFAQSATAGPDPFPRPTDGMDVAQRFFQASGPAVTLNGGLQILAAVALLAFAGVMTAHLRRVGRDGTPAHLVLAAGSVAAATLMIGGSVLITLGHPDVTGDAALTLALNQISFWLGGPLHVTALGLMIAAAATGLGGVLPRWLSGSGVVIGGLGMLAGLTGLVEVMAMFTLFGRFLGFVWLLIATIMIAIRETPAQRVSGSARSGA